MCYIRLDAIARSSLELRQESSVSIRNSLNTEHAVLKCYVTCSAFKNLVFMFNVKSLKITEYRTCRIKMLRDMFSIQKSCFYVQRQIPKNNGRRMLVFCCCFFFCFCFLLLFFFFVCVCVCVCVFFYFFFLLSKPFHSLKRLGICIFLLRILTIKTKITVLNNNNNSYILIHARTHQYYIDGSEIHVKSI